MDRPLFRRFPYTSVTLTLAFMVLVPSVVWDLSKFDLPGIDPLSINRSEIDIIAISFLLVIPAFFLDRAVARQRTNEDERVQFALGVARMGVWEWDLNSDAVTWSSTTAAVYGLSPEEAPASGRAFFELVHPDDRQALEADDRALREGRDLTSEFRILSSNRGRTARGPTPGRATARPACDHTHRSRHRQ
jgi:PAS domain-containing protein